MSVQREGGARLHDRSPCHDDDEFCLLLPLCCGEYIYSSRNPSRTLDRECIHRHRNVHSPSQKADTYFFQRGVAGSPDRSMQTRPRRKAAGEAGVRVKRCVDEICRPVGCDDGLNFATWVDGDKVQKKRLRLQNDHRGWGVVALGDAVVFNKNDVITEYVGTRVCNAMAKAMDVEGKATHIAALPGGEWCIDGYRKEQLDRSGAAAWGSLVNDPWGMGGKVANCRTHATKCVNGERVRGEARLFMVATRDIRGGEEVLLDYKGAGGLRYLMEGKVPQLQDPHWVKAKTACAETAMDVAFTK